jgi:hypothetical protein
MVVVRKSIIGKLCTTVATKLFVGLFPRPALPARLPGLKERA